MVKAVSFEEYFEERCLRASQFTYGIIIGGTIKDEECFFLPIGAPHKPNDSTEITNINKIDKIWVHKHCKNVNRMLPGNVRISGFFLTISEACTPSKECILDILKEICDSDKCNLKDLINDDHSEKMVLMINTDNCKLSCYAIDTEDSSDTLRQVEIRVRPVLNRWKAIRSSTSLSAEVKLSSDRRKEKILSKLEQVVVPYLRSLVNDTHMIVCNERLTDNTPLFEYYANTKIKKKMPSIKLKNVLIDTSSSDIDNEEYWSNLDFVFYGSTTNIGMNTCSSGSESGTSSDNGLQAYLSSLDQLGSSEVVDQCHNRHSDSFEKSLFLHGILPGIAFLPINATVGDAKNALRRDLVRSTLARLELITDELHISSGQIEVSRIYLPQRVLVRLPACRQLPLSDYKFSSETPEDVVSRLIYYSLPLGSSHYDGSCHSMIRSASHDGSFSKITQPIHKLNSTKTSSYAGIIADSLKRINQTALEGFESAKSIASSSNSIPDELEEIDSGHETADFEIAIDTNCVSFGLENEKNIGNIPDDFSKIGVINDIDNNIQHAVKHRSSLALFTIGSLCVLMFGLFVAYFTMAE